MNWEFLQSVFNIIAAFTIGVSLAFRWGIMSRVKELEDTVAALRDDFYEDDDYDREDRQ